MKTADGVEFALGMTVWDSHGKERRSSPETHEIAIARVPMRPGAPREAWEDFDQVQEKDPIDMPSDPRLKHIKMDIFFVPWVYSSRLAWMKAESTSLHAMAINAEAKARALDVLIAEAGSSQSEYERRVDRSGRMG